MPKNKIPKNAKLVFKGLMFDVYQWQQKMFDGSYVTYEAIKRQGTVVIIPTMGNKILTTIETQPNIPWTVGLIAGKIEREEKPLHSAKRELLEEAGLKSNDWELLHVHDANNSRKVDWNIYTYVARDCKKVAEPKLEPGEKIKIRMVDLSTFFKLPENAKRMDGFLVDYINKIKNSKEEQEKFKKKLFKNK